MQITIDPTIGPQGRWAEGVQRANAMLEQFLKGASAPVAAAWILTHDQCQSPLLKLTLSDSVASVEKSFEPGELDDGERLWFRLNRLWGDLLQIRSHKQLDKLRAALQASEEGADAR